MLTWADFLAQRRPTILQRFDAPGATQTVMVCSHIWWTEQIAYAVLNAGFNVLVHPPLYLFYTMDEAFSAFDTHWRQAIDAIRKSGVDVILGGNTAAMVVHPTTGEMLHEAAAANGKMPLLLNWWWDEPRSKPPLARGGVTPQQYISLLGRRGVVNAVWDRDVLEELEGEFGLKNLVHAPLGTLAEFWPQGFVPLERRPLVACFLGNCHFAAEWVETDDDALTAWARDVVSRKVADPRKPMQQCLGEATPRPGQSRHFTGDAWIDFQRPMEFINATYMHYTRNVMVKAAEAHLRGKLALIGKGWDKLGLRANMEHAGEKSGHIYAQSQMSLNLFGGCVHGGMPLRPYDIGASGGLIVTHDQRELPELFEPGKECLAFHTRDGLIEVMDRVRQDPAAYNAVALAGRRRVLAEHTWQRRVGMLLEKCRNLGEQGT